MRKEREHTSIGLRKVTLTSIGPACIPKVVLVDVNATAVCATDPLKLGSAPGGPTTIKPCPSMIIPRDQPVIYLSQSERRTKLRFNPSIKVTSIRLELYQ